MTPERWREITDLFQAALARDTVSRDAFLDEQCGDDADLRAEVATLLAAHLNADALDRPIASVPIVWYSNFRSGLFENVATRFSANTRASRSACWASIG